MMKKALVVDDHPLVRRGVKALLENTFPFLSVTESTGTDHVLEEVCRAPWAFVILDINLPGKNGIDVVRKAKRCCPNTPIIVFSMFPESHYATSALRAGALEYLSKDRPPLDLLAAVNTALQGQLIKKPRKTRVGPALSERELEVLNFLVKGMSRKEISIRLGISGKTVSTHRANIMHKLNLQNLSELIRYAFEEGLIG
jgi:DNA-binding NarL/FixJ family response regulator